MRGGGGMNDTNNETIGGIYAMLNKEENEKSETGGDDHIDYNMLGASRKNFGAAGGTGSSSDPYQQSSTLAMTKGSKSQMTSYM